MKWYVIVTALFIFSFSCQNNSDIPSAVIQPKQMQDIIWDMVRSDFYAEVLRQKDTLTTFPKISMLLTDQLLAFHNTNRVQVENSFKFYSSRPDIFKNILDSLTAQESRKNIPILIKPVKAGKTHLR